MLVLRLGNKDIFKGLCPLLWLFGYFRHECKPLHTTMGSAQYSHHDQLSGKQVDQRRACLDRTGRAHAQRASHENCVKEHGWLGATESLCIMRQLASSTFYPASPCLLHLSPACLLPMRGAATHPTGRSYGSRQPRAREGHPPPEAKGRNES